jgi:hypothetical protein
MMSAKKSIIQREECHPASIYHKYPYRETTFLKIVAICRTRALQSLQAVPIIEIDLEAAWGV